MLGAELRVRLPDRADLGMCGRIMFLGNLIGALGQHLSVPDDDRRESATALLDVSPSEIHSALNEIHGRPFGASTGLG